MSRKPLMLIAIASVVALLTGGIAIAAGVGEEEAPLTGTALEKATTAALAHTGGGTVIQTETGDDGAAFGVEVRLADGRVVEVELDEQFTVAGREADDDGPGENGEKED